MLRVLLATFATAASAHTYGYYPSAISAGGDLQDGNHTLVEAEAVCSGLAACKGFTYHSMDKTALSPVHVYFKSQTWLNGDATWSTFLKDRAPAPPPTPEMVNPCINSSSPAAKMKWCDATAPLSERVDDMIARMSLQEKIGSLSNTASAIPSLELPAYQWWSEATHGVASDQNGLNPMNGHGVRNTQAEPHQTNFPFPITTGMSFNRSLWYATGQQIGLEARAFMNQGNAYSTFWAPVINLAREPRWGRNIECPGEDPMLSGEYATSFVQGFERNPDDTTHIMASACCKHYAANSMEHTTEGLETHTRHNFDANITSQDLVDSYLAPFQACVEKGKVSGLMCSYNSINGVPSCANSWLLQEVARDSWGFDGYITSDCGAESDVFANHHYTKTPEESLKSILEAGTDNDCGGFFAKYVQSALNQSVITEQHLDTRLAMLLRVRMRLAHFDPIGPLQKIPPSVICSAEAKATARDAVAQSVTMVKNVDNTLPLNAQTPPKVAVIGPSAKQPKSILSYYGPSTSCDGKYWTMVDAIQQYASNTVYASGLTSTLSSPNSTDIAAAVTAAKASDEVVLCLGTDLSSAHEEMDAHNISLPQGQVELLKQVLAAAAKPIVIVIMTATPLDISQLLLHPKVGAVLHAGQPSVQTLGIGDIIFGAKAPAGRLIQTVYPASYADQVSIFDFNMRPGPSAFPRPDCTKLPCKMGTNPGRTYRFYNGAPVLPFGFGLSYTSFTYTTVSAPATVSLDALPALLAKSKHGFIPTAELAASGAATAFSVEVTNTGNVDADDVVLGFITPPSAGEGGVPLKSLFGFERVHVKAGQSVTVWLYPEYSAFTQVGAEGERVEHRGEYMVSFGVPEGAAYGMGFVEHSITTI